MYSRKGILGRKEEIEVSKQCSRFNPFYKDINEKSAIVYLKLRKEGCNKRDAIKFTSKNYCRTDITKLNDGPANFRKLKVKIDPLCIATNVFHLRLLNNLIGVES